MLRQVSVITISLNPGATLERTIRSITEQDYPRIEWVVIDGGSTDGSLEVYQRYAKHISVMISEKDKGISDAMNKGLANSSGDAMILLNAGDEFHSADTISRIMDTWDNEKYAWFTGGGEFYSEDGKFLYCRLFNPAIPVIELVANGCKIIHPSTMVSRPLFKKFGGFDLSYKSSMDYELWLRYLANGYEPQLGSFPVSKFYLGGTSGNAIKRYNEDRMARAVHGFLNSSVLERRLLVVAYAKQALAPVKKWGVVFKIKEFLKL
jgi:glycosyltransferase involved in cell wall biosynthesis